MNALASVRSDKDKLQAHGAFSAAAGISGPSA